MRRVGWICLAVCLFVAAAACSGPTGDLRGATPVGYVRPVLNPLMDETAEPITIADLVETPEEYEGELLEVSGVYYSRQVVVCTTRPQRSPARWALSDGEDRIPAGGFDERLEALPSGRIELTVTGRMVRWQGPVGCGRQAAITEVWYLDVIDIVAPNPVTIAEVGSDAGETTIQEEPTESAEGTSEDGTAEPDATQPPVTETITGTEVVSLPDPAGTPVLLPTPSPSTNTGPTATATATSAAANTPTATPTTGGSSPTPTGTSSAGTPTASPTTSNGSPAPTATSGGDDPVIVDQEELPHRSIETGELGPNEIHRWPFVITSTAVITVNVASEFDLDIAVSIVDPSGQVLARQNNAQGGEPEVLTAVSLPQPGSYDILISSENDEAGHYAVLALDVLNEEYYTFVFNKTLALEDDDAGELKPNNDHFWFFYGTEGETVSIIVLPVDNSNLFLYLFDADGSIIVDFLNETDEGEAEEILEYTLPNTGLYSILVGELNFGPSSYVIAVLSG